MTKEGLSDQTIRDYLLLQATALDQELIELRLLTDEAFAAHVKMIEDEMVDDYAFGRLGQQERERFESHFLTTPGRKLNLKFAQAVQEYLNIKFNTAGTLSDSERKSSRRKKPEGR